MKAIEGIGTLLWYWAQDILYLSFFFLCLVLGGVLFLGGLALEVASNIKFRR